jgi:TatD DNase family protein
MLVDSHCHIPLMDPPDAEAVLAAARENGVGYLLCVSVELESFPELRDLARAHAEISASVGLHPNHEAGHEPTVEQLVTLADDPDIVALGETGLDYYRSQGDLDWQRDRFRTHIQAAKQAGKPLIIHSREAPDDTIRILREEGADQVGGVMHCFVDDWQTAQAAMDLGFYISFSGIVTFKNAREVQAVARQVPLDRLLVETDSPYLAPVPHRGRPNQPAYVQHVAECLAELRNEPFDQLAQATTENFFRLFKTAKRL